MDTVDYLPSVAAPDRARRRWRPADSTVQRAAVWAFWLTVAVAVLIRLYNPSPLWLDEAQSVAIARLPMHDLMTGLREDGSPPFYYLLLHYWISAFGTGTLAVRALSSLISLVTLPLAYLVGRSWRDELTGRLAVVVIGVSPFAVRYATETRMYQLLILLALFMLWALSAAARRPTLPRLAAVAVVSGLLALTHYWALFLLAALFLTLAARRQWRLVAGLVAGAVLFAPWLPTFLYQTKHTGTPWASPPGLAAIFEVGRQWAGGTRWQADGMFMVALLLAVVAVIGKRSIGGVLLAWPPSRTGSFFLAGSAGTLLVGVLASELVRAGFPVRYSAVAFAPGVLLLAIGARRLPRDARLLAMATLAVLGLVSSVGLPFQNNRTQAGKTAAILRADLQPGDLVVYCPDQLGPAVSRLLPPGTAQVVYPTLGPADRVNWVDYQQRNKNADVSAIAKVIDARARGAIWLVAFPGYRTYSSQCEQLTYMLTGLRGGLVTYQQPDVRYAEPNYLIRFPGR
jgi:hypothetical protein